MNVSHTTQEFETIPKMLPVIPTMDIVVFPHMIVPLLVLDEKIINGINATLQESKLVFLLAAKNLVDAQGAIGTQDLYRVGTIATIMRLIKLPEGGIKILVQGLHRGLATQLTTQHNMLHAEVDFIHMVDDTVDTLVPQIRGIKSLAEKMVSTGSSLSPDFHIILSKMNDAEKIADFVLSHLNLNVEQSQQLLEMNTYQALLEGIYQHLSREIEVAELQEKIRNDARESMNQLQKEFFLREQVKAIKKELGEDDSQDIEQMHEKLATLPMPDETKADVMRQIHRLERTSPDSLEAAVTRNHLEWIFSLPWGVYTQENLDIQHAKGVLDTDHHGLAEVKDRILDFISVRKLKTDGYAPILCFVGPPGTGKTSLGQSIAKALSRNYARISLGGVKDEAEIRGHRRTYVGAMPGRFIQALRKANSCNPVIVIDELDKIGADFRGDPSAAMLEVLDPQQNSTFYDNYLGVPFDLSRVLFIATANTLDQITEPLRDRMEIIELSGYTYDEKLHIAKNHLLRHALLDMGLQDFPLHIHDDIISNIISNYTREAGVRHLERSLRKLVSKAARHLAEHTSLDQFNPTALDQHLGPKHFLDDDISHEDQVGISQGLAWTAYGGEILKIEAVLMPGKGKLMLTGQLGSVMKESAQAAISYVRAHAKEYGVNERLFTTTDLHIHVPAGAIPKDGPSAGITILTAVLSAYTNRPINAEYAMTGELNLRGEVMPIGGLKEKILAAKRNKVQHIIAPTKNKHDVAGMDEVLKGIDIIWVNHAAEVLEKVLLPRSDLKKQTSR